MNKYIQWTIAFSVGVLVATVVILTTDSMSNKPRFYCNGTTGVYYTSNTTAVQTYDPACCHAEYCND